MQRIFLNSVAAVLAAWLMTPTRASAADHRDDEAAIRKAAEAYIIAFDNRDAKALAAFWSPHAVYASPMSGKQVEGRPAIEAEFAAMFKQAGKARLNVKIESIRFITDNVATEDGTAQVVRPDEPPSDSTYAAIHVKKDGKWLIDSVRETVQPEPPTAAEHLKDLDWMVGRWGDADGNASVKTLCEWTANHAFLTRSFDIMTAGGERFQGTQVIGWDPSKKQFRSWAFDSDGGFAEGVWKRDGDRWIIQSTSALPDGRKGVATNVLRRIDENHFGWRSHAREVDGELLPNVDEIVAERQ